jgi:hypothetical protein
MAYQLDELWLIVESTGTERPAGVGVLRQEGLSGHGQ